MLVEVDRLLAFAGRIFEAAGCSPEEARRVAEGLVDANLTGHDSHGVARVPRYVDWLASGEVEAGRHVAVLSEAGAQSVLDGQYGFGATVGREAVEFGLGKAAEFGFALVALRHAGHLGRIGQWAELAVGRGYVSLHIVNVAGSRIVAPFGGVDRRFSTAPIAFGFPVPGQDPVILDFATSAVAEGKALVASNGGKPLPPGSLIGPDGRQTADPEALYGPLVADGPRDYRKGEGAIRAMGDHKGSGLALMCELLGGILTGSGAAGPQNHRFANGMVSLYMSPAAFGQENVIAAEARDFMDYVRASRPAEAGGRVLVPGEPERMTRQERSRNGVPLPDGTWAAILATAASLGVEPPQVL